MTGARVSVSAVAADTEDELRSLARWLREDETLDGGLRTEFEAAGPAPDGAMGTGFDVLQLVLGSALSTAALAVSVLQWQLSRRRAPHLVLSRGELRVEISGEAARDEETLRRVLAVLEPDGPGGPGGPGTDGEDTADDGAS